MRIPENNKQFSNGEINRAGNVIREKDPSTEEYKIAMKVFSLWRDSHEKPLSYATEILEKELRGIDLEAIVAQRPKTFYSVKTKLVRFPKMKLSQVQDIGGCRAIVSSQKKAKKLIRALKKRKEFRDGDGKIRYKNYIEKPKEDGYRSYHLNGRFPDCNGGRKWIEIQIRTNLQHSWATALEIVDLFEGQTMKTGGAGKGRWKEFFILISKQFSILENCSSYNICESNQNNFKIKENYNLNNAKLEGHYESRLRREFMNAVGVLSEEDNIKRITKLYKDIQDKFKGYTISFKRMTSKIESKYALVRIDFSSSNDPETSSQYFNENEVLDCEKELQIREIRDRENPRIINVMIACNNINEIKEAYPNYFADSENFIHRANKIVTFFSPETKQSTSFLKSLFK